MNKREQIRPTNWQFTVLQQAGDGRSVARTCQHYGISRRTRYKWRRRFADQGVAGLCNRPGRPHHSPRAKPAEVIAKILYLREYHHFGAGRIADYLKRKRYEKPQPGHRLQVDVKFLERIPGSTWRTWISSTRTSGRARRT